MNQVGVRGEGNRGDTPPPKVTSEQLATETNKIGAVKTKDTAGEEADFLAKEKQRKAKAEMRGQYEEIYKALDRKIAEFVIERNGEFPNMNEARSIFKDMQEFLDSVDFFEKDLLLESAQKGEPFLDTGTKVEMKVEDDEMVDGQVAGFDLVVENGKFKLWPRDRDDTEEGVLEQRIMARE